MLETLDERVVTVARERWDNAAPAERRALRAAAGRGEIRDDAAEAAVVAVLADREAARLAKLAHPVRLTIWRAAQALMGLFCLVAAGVALADGNRLGAALGVVLGAVFTASAARARTRLVRQIDRVLRAREGNLERAA